MYPCHDRSISVLQEARCWVTFENMGEMKISQGMQKIPVIPAAQAALCRFSGKVSFVVNKKMN